MDHVVTAIGCLEATPAKIEGVGIVAMEELRVHGHQEMFGEALLAVLALQFLGGIGVGHIVEVKHVLGEVCTGGHTQMGVGVRIEVLLQDVVEFLLGGWCLWMVNGSPIVEVLEESRVSDV